MSRRIPPTPVAAPWNGSTAEGWLWLSTLNATARPSPRSSTPAFSPGPWSTRSPDARQPLQEERGVLVAAVLGPEEREDRELEVVRVSPEQRADTLVLPVREAEGAMERLFRDAAHRRLGRRGAGRGPGNREVPRVFREEGGTWGNHGFPDEREPKASVAQSGQPIGATDLLAPPGGARSRAPATAGRDHAGSLSPCAATGPPLFLLAAIWGASYLFIKVGVATSSRPR